MAARKGSENQKNGNGDTVGFEAKLWAAADALRNNMDAAEYKHVVVDEAMAAIERDNPSLKNVLPREFARLGLDKQRLGQLINLVSDIGFGWPRRPRQEPGRAGVSRPNLIFHSGTSRPEASRFVAAMRSQPVTSSQRRGAND